MLNHNLNNDGDNLNSISANSDQHGSICIKFFHFLPVILVYLVIITIFYSFFAYYIKEGEITLSKIILLIVVIMSTFLMIICHILCMVTNPGIVNERISDKTQSNLDSQYLNLYCDKCERRRPERAHHCRVCGCCILKMDHHCPWIMNCVGLFNQKYFYLLLFYTIIASFSAFLGMVNQFLELDEKFQTFAHNEYNNKLLDSNPKETDKFKHPIIDPLLIMFSTVFLPLLILGVGFLFISQTYFILNNMTYIEYIKFQKKEDSPYYSGDKFNNFRQVMGKSFLFWIFPLLMDNDQHKYSKNLNKTPTDVEQEKELLIK